MKKHRVVVGVDGSPTSRRALAWAHEEARLRSADLDVIMTWAMPTMAPYAAFTPPFADLEGAATATVQELVGSVLGPNGPTDVTVIPTVVMAQPAGALIAASNDADLLVIGSRGWNTLVGLVLGSVSQQCVTHANCPVAVIPPVGDDAPADGPVELMPAGQVVVGVDGSPGADDAVRWAADDARRRGAPLLGVLSYSHLVYSGTEGGIEFTPDLDEAAALGTVEEIMARSVAGGDDVKTRSEVTAEAPAVALHNRCGPDDVLVVGARGFGGFKGLLLGSVSLQTLRHAPCAVVVVHPPDDHRGT